MNNNNLSSSLTIAINSILSSPSTFTSTNFISLYNTVFTYCTKKTRIYEIRGRTIYTAIRSIVHKYTLGLKFTTIEDLQSTIYNYSRATNILLGTFSYLQKYFIKSSVDRRDTSVVPLKKLLYILLYRNYIERIEDKILDLIIYNTNRNIIYIYKDILYINDEHKRYIKVIDKYIMYLKTKIHFDINIKLLLQTLRNEFILLDGLFDIKTTRRIKKELLREIIKRKNEIVYFIINNRNIESSKENMDIKIFTFTIIINIPNFYKQFIEEYKKIDKELRNKCIYHLILTLSLKIQELHTIFNNNKEIRKILTDSIKDIINIKDNKLLCINKDNINNDNIDKDNNNIDKCDNNNINNNIDNKLLCINKDKCDNNNIDNNINNNTLIKDNINNIDKDKCDNNNIDNKLLCINKDKCINNTLIDNINNNIDNNINNNIITNQSSTTINNNINNNINNKLSINKDILITINYILIRNNLITDIKYILESIALIILSLEYPSGIRKYLMQDMQERILFNRSKIEEEGILVEEIKKYNGDDFISSIPVKDIINNSRRYMIDYDREYKLLDIKDEGMMEVNIIFLTKSLWGIKYTDGYIHPLLSKVFNILSDDFCRKYRRSRVEYAGELSRLYISVDDKDIIVDSIVGSYLMLINEGGVVAEQVDCGVLIFMVENGLVEFIHNSNCIYNNITDGEQPIKMHGTCGLKVADGIREGSYFREKCYYESEKDTSNGGVFNYKNIISSFVVRLLKGRRMAENELYDSIYNIYNISEYKSLVEEAVKELVDKEFIAEDNGYYIYIP